MQLNLLDFDATAHINTKALVKKFGDGKIEMELKVYTFSLAIYAENTLYYCMILLASELAVRFYS